MQLDRGDNLYGVKEWLLSQLGAQLPAKWQTLDISTCAAAARVLCLRQNEVQQLRSIADLYQLINPRSEAAALALLVSNQQMICGSSAERQQQLQQLLAAYPDGTNITAAAAAVSYADDSPEQKLFRWVLTEGATCQLQPASFSSSSSSDAAAAAAALRGCSASADLPAGCTVITLPSKLLITYKSAAESDFGQVLKRLGLDDETLAVIWTMVDRWDEDSMSKPFWDALPTGFDTGLSVPEPLIHLMNGLPEHAEFKRARQHVREQFQQLQQIFQVLLTAYPSFLQPSWFTEAAYLWAVELWYAYAIQVKFPDGTIQPALAPFVSLVNHSAYPHIVHFSTVNPKTRQLNLTSFRPLQQGQQAFLSYGPLPNAQLLLFYGFAIEQNPFEEAVLTLPQQQQGVAAVELLQQLKLQQRQCMLTVQQPLPVELLPYLTVICITDVDVAAVRHAVQKAVQQQEGVKRPKSSSSKSKAKCKGSLRDNVSSSSSSDSKTISTAADLKAAWDAAALWQAVLEEPLSDASRTAVQQTLSGMLAAAKEPYEMCLRKIAKRRQLQMVLQQQKQSAGGDGSSCSSADSYEGFLSGLETFCSGMVALFSACGDAAAAKLRTAAVL